MSVATAGSTAGTVNDAVSIGGAGAANLIGIVSNVVGVYLFDWPCQSGLVFVLGTGQVASISYT